MKNARKIIALCWGLVLSAPLVAQDLMIFDNGEYEAVPGAFLGSNATTDPATRAADDFVLVQGASTIAEVLWWSAVDGVYGANGPEDVHITAVPDNGGRPADIGAITLYAGPLSGGATLVENATSTYRFSVGFPAQELVPGTYWLVIQHDARTTGNVWSWRASDSSGGNAHQINSAAGWTQVDPALSLAFKLFAPAPPTPEDCTAAYEEFFAIYTAEEASNTLAMCSQGGGEFTLEREGVNSEGAGIYFVASDLGKHCSVEVGVIGEAPTASYESDLTAAESRDWKKFLRSRCSEATEPAGKTVFVTSGHYTGDLLAEVDALNVKGKPFKGNSGLEAADYICQYHAKNGGLSGRYSAWLSDSTTDAIDRITTASVPYLMPDGTQVAASFEPFIDSGTLLDHPVCVDELLNAHCDEDYNAMTGTPEFGVYRSGLACSDWQDGTGFGNTVVGTTTDEVVNSQVLGATSRWTDRGVRACNVPRQIYCFED